MILEATFNDDSTIVYTKSVYQYSGNATLVVHGLDLPASYEVHFSNDKERGISVICEGDPTGVIVPNELLSTGAYVYAWFNCAAKDSFSNGTQCTVVIPVIPRPIPVHSTSIGDGDFKYRIDEDEEDLEFFGKPNQMLIPNIERDD